MTWESLRDVVGKAIRGARADRIVAEEERSVPWSDPSRAPTSSERPGRIGLASFPREIPAAWTYRIADRGRARPSLRA
ncbi:MAG TPA: hypothetical protein VMJ92_02570 [Candidatus Limnocylindrales bacterium]|nr:hypothetical protein [Candidatus Limnocylindrales bacterium]